MGSAWQYEGADDFFKKIHNSLVTPLYGAEFEHMKVQIKFITSFVWSIVNYYCFFRLFLLYTVISFRKSTLKLKKCLCVCVFELSLIQLFVTPWTVTHVAPLSMDFFSQEHWSGLTFLSPGDLPSPGIEPGCLLHLLRWQADSLPLVPNVPILWSI